MMGEAGQAMHVSSRIDALLSHVGGKPTVATALLDALTKHIERKTHTLRQCVHTFESKWEMSFEEFSERVNAGKLTRLSFDVECDFQAWKQAVTLLKHYQSLRTQ
jgi:hypothetical protein